MTDERKPLFADAVDMIKRDVPDIIERLDALDAGALAFDAKRLRASRCDQCGAHADVVHFVDYWRGPVAVKFSCPSHDFGGYWADFKRFTNPQEKFAEHIFLKVWGPAAIAALNERLAQVQLPTELTRGVRLKAKTLKAIKKRADAIGKTVDELIGEACDSLAAYEAEADDDEAPF
jgi:hypothetical protein